MGMITDFIESTKNGSDHNDLQKFIAQVPSSFEFITLKLDSFQKLIKHVEQKIETADPKAKNEWQKFVSDIRKKILRMLYDSLDHSDGKVYAKNLLTVFGMYGKTQKICSECIEFELNTEISIDANKRFNIFDSVMNKLIAFPTSTTKRKCLLRIWEHSIFPVQKLVNKGELSPLFHQFRSKINAIDAISLYIASSSFKQANDTIFLDKNQPKSYNFSTISFSAFSSKEDIGAFFALVNPGEKIYKDVLNNCFKDPNTPYTTYFSFLFLNSVGPANFLDELSSVKEEEKLHVMPKVREALAGYALTNTWNHAIRKFSSIINFNKRMTLPTFYTNEYEYIKDQMVYNAYNNVVKLEKAIDFRKYCINFLKEHLMEKLIKSKGDDFSMPVTELAVAAREWVVSNADDHNFLQAIEELFSEILKAFIVKNPSSKDAINFISAFYTKAPSIVQQAILKQLCHYNPKHFLSPTSKTAVNFFAKVFLNVDERDHTKHPFATYESKILLIQKIQEKKIDYENKFIDYLVTQALENANSDCGSLISVPPSATSTLENSAEINGDTDLDKFIKSFVFAQYMLNKIKISDHKAILVYIGQKYPVIFENNIASLFKRKASGLANEKIQFLTECWTLFEINQELFFDYLNEHLDYNRKIEILYYFLNDCYPKNCTDFSAYLNFAKKSMALVSYSVPDNIPAAHPQPELYERHYKTTESTLIESSPDRALSIKKPENLLKLIEMHPDLLRSKSTSRKFAFFETSYSRNSFPQFMASCIVDVYCKMSINDLMAVLSPICKSLSTNNNDLNFQMTGILWVISENFKLKEIAPPPELCWFIAKTLGQIPSTYFDSKPYYKILLKQLSELRNVKGNTQFDQYLAHIRQAFYPAAENTAIASVMDKGRKFFYSKSSTGEAFQRLLGETGSAPMKPGASPIALPGFDAALPNSSVVQEFWGKLDNCKKASTNGFSMWSSSSSTKKSIPVAMTVPVGTAPAIVYLQDGISSLTSSSQQNMSGSY